MPRASGSGIKKQNVVPVRKMSQTSLFLQVVYYYTDKVNAIGISFIFLVTTEFREKFRFRMQLIIRKTRSFIPNCQFNFTAYYTINTGICRCLADHGTFHLEVHFAKLFQFLIKVQKVLQTRSRQKSILQGIFQFHQQ